MHELDKYFLRCLEAERTQFARQIDELSRELWPSGNLVKKIKKLLVDDPVLSSEIDGPAGAVSSLKAAARGNEHAERVRRILVRELAHTDTFQVASRRVLKNWISDWAQQDMRWQRAPIRFYPATNAMAPCLQENGVLCNRKDVPATVKSYQFDATWLWDVYCVYAWHRWADDASDLSELQNMVNACGRSRESIYKDRQPRFLFIVHGPAGEDANRRIKCPANVRIVAPWEITNALTGMADNKSERKVGS